jgi:Hint domain
LATYNYTGSVQSFTVTQAGTYDITAYGAQGGAGGGGNFAGGKGAEIGGDFTLPAGASLTIIVGGQGAGGVGSDPGAGGGGGGSFVVETYNNVRTVLEIASGGGGGGYNYGGSGGLTGSSGGKGGSASGGAGGTSGGGGGGGSEEAGGGGYVGGAYVYRATGHSGTGYSVNGGYAGGAGPRFGGGKGGYGGGGGAGYGYGSGGGGGGGYSGGGGGGTPQYQGMTTGYGGGGGGSIFHGANEVASAGENAGNGEVTLELVCYLRGTCILTPKGEVPVERLTVGDAVVTRTGIRRLVWIGTGRAQVVRGQRNAATPVIIRKSAIADNVPNRDLRVTKGHSLFIDDVLIPAEFLVNHRSILWDDVAQEVSVYHLELEDHDVLFANGTAAESYRDDGNRWLFRNANSGWHLPPKPPCAPVLTGGPMVDGIWRRLLDRAGRRPSLPVTHDPDVHLLVDRRRIDATSRSGDHYLFRLPGSPASVRIISREGVPAELGLVRDSRSLGVAIRRIQVTRGRHLDLVEADDARLVDGFHGYEPVEDLRWTNGNAGLPTDLFSGFIEPIELRLHVTGSMSYPLSAPLDREAA